MLVAVCSLNGSPGVTTFAVALAVRWAEQGRCVLVECDPSGGDVAARLGLASSPGLVSLAAAARRGGGPGLLWRHAQPLPGGVPVVLAPPGAEQARAALAALVPGQGGGPGVLRQAGDAPGAVVIADCGRVDPGTPVLPVVREAEAMLVLSRAHAEDLAHLAAAVAVVGRWSRRPGLLLVGEGYSTAEVSRGLGVPVLARIPEDRSGAAVLCGRRGGRRGPSHSALGQIAGAVARMLAAPSVPPPGPGRPTGPAGVAGPGPRPVPTSVTWPVPPSVLPVPAPGTAPSRTGPEPDPRPRNGAAP